MDSQVAYWRTCIFLAAKSLSTKGFPISINLLIVRKFKLLYCCCLLFFIDINTCMCTYVEGGAPFTLLPLLISGFATTVKVKASFTLMFNNVYHFRNHGKIMRILSSFI